MSPYQRTRFPPPSSAVDLQISLAAYCEPSLHDPSAAAGWESSSRTANSGTLSGPAMATPSSCCCWTAGGLQCPPLGGPCCPDRYARTRRCCRLSVLHRWDTAAQPSEKRRQWFLTQEPKLITFVLNELTAEVTGAPASLLPVLSSHKGSLEQTSG